MTQSTRGRSVPTGEAVFAAAGLVWRRRPCQQVPVAVYSVPPARMQWHPWIPRSGSAKPDLQTAPPLDISPLPDRLISRAGNSPIVLRVASWLTSNRGSDRRNPAANQIDADRRAERRCLPRVRGRSGESTGTTEALRAALHRADCRI